MSIINILCNFACFNLLLLFLRNKEKIDKITTSLNLKISVRDSKFTDSRVHLQAILRQWLPLSDAMLNMVCEYLPSPLDISEERVKKLMCSGFKKFESYPEQTQKLKDGGCVFRSDGGLVVECLPPVRKVVGSNPRPGLTKDIKSGT